MDVVLTRTRDMDLVEQIARHPKVWPHLHDDGTPEDWAPFDHDSVHWMLVLVEGTVMGAFLVHPHSAYCYEMHTCMLPAAWGAVAAKGAQLLLEWAFTQTPCEKMGTRVPEYNRAALRFALAGGMTHEGVNRASFKRNGRMIDQIMLGITKEEWVSCRQQSQQ